MRHRGVVGVKNAGCGGVATDNRAITPQCSREEFLQVNLAG